MIEASKFVEAAERKGFGLYSGVPCSYLKPFINYVIDSDQLRYVGAANEGDAVAIAAGAEIAGTRAVAMFQNSGLGNAVNALTSLTYTFKLPILLIPTLRGEPGGAADEPQHELMGAITTDMLDLMQIRWEYFPVEDAEVEPALERAVNYMDEMQLPYALVMRKGSVAPATLKSQAKVQVPGKFSGAIAVAEAQRCDVLYAIQAAVPEDAVIVATTGYTGRELYACSDRPSQIYMVGSMGCAISLGLGIALAQPERKVVVLDGDGAALMRLGAQSIVGYEQPANLTHVLLDNAIHESTGGQATVARSVDFCSIAAASGYSSVVSVAEPQAIAAAVNELAGPAFVHAPILTGVPEGLPRPTATPAEVAVRLREFMQP
jgi:phosphonopyruvate decarboxylase